VTAAYQILGSESSKKEYDRLIGNFGSDYSSTYNGRSSSWTGGVRHPATGRSGFVSRDQFNVHEWNAYHYGDEDGENVKQEPIRRHNSGWVDPTNKHQSYYRKKYAREWAEKATGEKWNADTAHRRYTASASGGEDRHQRNTNPYSNRDVRSPRTKAPDAETADEEKKRQAVMENLKKSRMERKERESQQTSAESGVSQSAEKKDACCVS
jgi:hypothetical protein